MNPPIGINKLIYIGTAAILVVLAYATWSTLASAADGVLVLTVSPPDSTITIDGHTKTKPGTLSLVPGSHELSISHKDFDTKTVTVNITGGQKDSQGVTLSPVTGSTPAAAANTSQQQAGEGASGAVADQEAAKITANNPLIKQLPYYGEDFNIDIGTSQQHPGTDAVAIYITAAGDAAKAKAIAWIKAQGYDPNAYEIIYQTASE